MGSRSPLHTCGGIQEGLPGGEQGHQEAPPSTPTFLLKLGSHGNTK